MSVRLIVDTDTAGDDVTSLLIALLHPNAQLEAITICNGNVRFEQQVENALYTVEQAGKSVPVYAGCPKPLVASLHRGRSGPVLATLMTDRASEAAGQVVLLPGDRETLLANGLFLAVRTMAAPKQVEHAPLRVSPM